MVNKPIYNYINLYNLGHKLYTNYNVLINLLNIKNNNIKYLMIND